MCELKAFNTLLWVCCSLRYPYNLTKLQQHAAPSRSLMSTSSRTLSSELHTLRSSRPHLSELDNLGQLDVQLGAEVDTGLDVGRGRRQLRLHQLHGAALELLNLSAAQRGEISRGTDTCLRSAQHRHRLSSFTDNVSNSIRMSITLLHTHLKNEKPNNAYNRI